MSTEHRYSNSTQQHNPQSQDTHNRHNRFAQHPITQQQQPPPQYSYGNQQPPPYQYSPSLLNKHQTMSLPTSSTNNNATPTTPKNVYARSNIHQRILPPLDSNKNDTESRNNSQSLSHNSISSQYQQQGQQRDSMDANTHSIQPPRSNATTNDGEVNNIERDLTPTTISSNNKMNASTNSISSNNNWVSYYKSENDNLRNTIQSLSMYLERVKSAYQKRFDEQANLIFQLQNKLQDDRVQNAETISSNGYQANNNGNMNNQSNTGNSTVSANNTRKNETLVDNIMKLATVIQQQRRQEEQEHHNNQQQSPIRQNNAYLGGESHINISQNSYEQPTSQSHEYSLGKSTDNSNNINNNRYQYSNQIQPQKHSQSMPQQLQSLETPDFQPQILKNVKEAVPAVQQDHIGNNSNDRYGSYLDVKTDHGKKLFFREPNQEIVNNSNGTDLKDTTHSSSSNVTNKPPTDTNNNNANSGSRKRARSADPSKKRFKCEECDKEFVLKSSLNNHVTNVHSNVRLFACEFCDKTCTTKQLLTNHINGNHLNKKPFVCEFCAKGFVSKQNMEAHRDRIHLKHKNYKCESCQKEFYSKYDFSKHKC